MLAPSATQGPTARAKNLWRANPAAMAALIVALAGTATIAGAWFFELVIKLKPCPLCLEQRVPYYVAISIQEQGTWKRISDPPFATGRNGDEALRDAMVFLTERLAA